MTESQTTTVTIDRETNSWIEAIKAQTRLSKQDIVRIAIERLMTSGVKIEFTPSPTPQAQQ
jgi:hypothetical protein